MVCPHSLVAHHGAGGVRWAGARAPPHADAHAPGRPVDQREEGVVDAEDDGEVGVVDVDGTGGHHDVDQTGYGVDAVQEYVENIHPRAWT